MNEPLQTPESIPPESERPRKPWVMVLIGALALVVLALPAIWFWRNSQQPQLPQTPAVVAPVVEAPPPAEVSIPRAETDAKSLLQSLSPRLAELIGEEGVLRKVVAAVQLASEGESWLQLFPKLRPSQPFEVETRAGKSFIAASSYRRYDALTETITAIDADELGAAYGKLKPALEQLYREVGRPGTTFDSALGKALGVVVSAKVDAGPVEVVPKGLVFAFKDPTREALDPTSKLLARLGADNAQKLQTYAKRFAASAKVTLP
ncbi:MAG: DUF3014 domain-containing protein [Myxococcaceae bacterium]